MKAFKKVLALMLVLSMVFALCVPAYAFGWKKTTGSEEKIPYKYVSLGASNTLGYGLHGYWPLPMYDDPSSVFSGTTDGGISYARDGYFTSGYYYYSNDAYPVLVKNGLQERLGDDYDVQLKQCAINSMRAYDLRWMLDDEWPSDGYIAWRLGDGSSGWKYDIERERHQVISVDGWDDIVIDKGQTDLRAEIQEALYTADFITYDLGINDFGSYLKPALFKSQSVSMIDCNLENVLPEYLDLYYAAKEKLMSFLQEKAGNVLSTERMDFDKLIDYLTYAYIGFVQSFDKSMELIYSHNPDVKIVVCSIGNVFEDISMTVGGNKLPFGELMGIIVDLANAYTAVLSPYHNNYYYAHTSSNGHVEYFNEKMLDWDESSPDTLDPCIVDAFSGYDSMFITPNVTKNELKNNGYSVYDADGVYMYNIKPTPGSEDYALYEKRCNDAQRYLLAYFCKKALENSNLIVSSPDELSSIDVASVLQSGVWLYGLGGDYTQLATGRALNWGTAGVPTMDSIYAWERGVVNSLLSSDSAKAASFFYVYTTFAACFFSHPTMDGHRQMANVIFKAYDNKISGVKSAILALDDMDEQIEEMILNFGIKFKMQLLSNIADKLGLDTAIIDAAAADSAGIASRLASFLGIYNRGAMETLADIVRLTISEYDECMHISLTKVPAHRATALTAGNIEYYICKDCGQYFYDSRAKEPIANKSYVYTTHSGLYNIFSSVMTSSVKGAEGMINLISNIFSKVFAVGRV